MTRINLINPKELNTKHLDSVSFKQSNYYMANLFNDRIFFTSFAYSQSNDQLNVTTLNEDATSVIKYSILGSKQYSFMNLVNYYGRIMINYRESGGIIN